MKISKIRDYGNARYKLARLGLAELYMGLEEILLSTEVYVKDKKHANGAGAVRKWIDAKFEEVNKEVEDQAYHWIKATTGDIDWVRKKRINNSSVVAIGVEIQVSGRSEGMATDLVHIRNQIQEGKVDVGILVVPDDDFARLLTDRVASYSYAVTYCENHFKDIKDSPVMIIGLSPDGYSETAIIKATTNLGSGNR